MEVLFADLDRSTQSEISSLKEELKMEHFKRISQEALIHQDIENLHESLGDRDHELYRAKRRICSLLQEREKGQQWNAGISSTLIDGVGATVEMFETMTWTLEDEKEGKKSKRVTPSVNLSSKSFG